MLIQPCLGLKIWLKPLKISWNHEKLWNQLLLPGCIWIHEHHKKGLRGCGLQKVKPPGWFVHNGWRLPQEMLKKPIQPLQPAATDMRTSRGLQRCSWNWRKWSTRMPWWRNLRMGWDLWPEDKFWKGIWRRLHNRWVRYWWGGRTGAPGQWRFWPEISWYGAARRWCRCGLDTRAAVMSAAKKSCNE